MSILPQPNRSRTRPDADTPIEADVPPDARPDTPRSSRTWCQAARREPCPSCDHLDCCRVFVDGAWECIRTRNDNPYRPIAPWAAAPPSEQQVRLLRRLGVPLSLTRTTGDAADAITAALAAEMA